MDKSEQLAQQYLRSLNIGTVIYEPDGNIPPDFAVGGRIAVEVRRLNQNFEFDDGSRQGLEQLEIPLWNRFKSFLPLLGPSLNGECWYVGLDFRRPLEKWKTLEPLLRSQLRAFMSQPLREQTTLHVTSNLNLDLIRSSKDHGTFFLLGASSDDDSGGWIMAEIERNLRLCIAEKEKKIEPYRSNYSAWWLVLPDYIDYAMEDKDRSVFRSEVMPRIPHRFDRIVLLDPRDYRRAVEV
ncbi:hypothetical protein [Nitrosomonas sp. wSCUT-2]